MHNSRVVNFKTNYLRSVILTGLIAFIISCNNHEPVTFPADETEFANPVTVPKKINWKVSRSKGLKAPILHAMAIDKLPSKPFYPDGYIPLKQTIGIKSFDINNLPDSSFDISSFPAIPLDIETIKIDQPLISWAGLPKLVEKSGIGLFEFGMDQGMASSIVTAMLQDGHGMIWLATENGLCRFDGEYLESYFFIEKVFNGGQAIVTQLLEDELGRIWIKTDLWVIYVFDRKSAILKKIVVPDAFQVDNDLIRDRHGKIWMGSRDNGLYIIDPAKLAIRHIPKFQEGDSGNVHNLLEDKAGKIWIGSSQGLKIIDPVKKVIRFMFGKSGLLNDTVSALFQSGDGRIWVAEGSKGVQIFDQIKEEVESLEKSSDVEFIVNAFLEDQRQDIWMSTNRGVKIFNTKTKKIKTIDDRSGLIDDQVKKLLEDDQGQVWIATGGGLNLYHNSGLQPFYYDNKSGVSSNQIWGFLEDVNKRIWICEEQVLDIYDSVKQVIKRFEDPGIFKNAASYIRLIRGSDSSLLIGTPGVGVFNYNIYDNTIIPLTRQQGLQNVNMVEIMKDSQGNIWTCSFNEGLEFIDLGRGEFNTLYKDEALKGRNYWNVMEDNFKQVWVGSDSALGIIDAERNMIRTIADSSFFRSGLFAFSTDDMGRIWIAGLMGLAVVDIQRQAITYFTDKTGLIASEVFSIYNFNGRMYAATGNGITVFTPKPINTGTSSANPQWDIHSFGKGQGFKFLDFNGGAVFAANKKFWWGIEQKVLAITEVPKYDTVVLPVSISGITMADYPANFLQADILKSKKVEWDSISGEYNLPENLILPYNQNYIRFRFTGSQLTNRDKIRYRYCLEGVDTAWSLIANQPLSDNYLNIPPGKYAFKVCCRNAYGLWSHSRCSNGQMEPTDLNALCDEYLRLSYHGLRAKDKSFNATLETDYGFTVGKVKVIPQDIGRVLLNLFNNAFYAVADKKKKAESDYQPTVSISTRRVDEKVQIIVRDNGAGIPQKLQGKIFQPFFTTKPTGQGTGLGLSLSYDIIKAHGGEILVKSSPGEGTVFSINLPDSNKI